MNVVTAKEKLSQIEQEHLFQGWDRLSIANRLSLLHQIELLDPNKLQQMRSKVASHQVERPSSISPIEDVVEADFSDNAADALKGQRLIREGRLGCLLVAGGQGTRLGFDGPKGMMPVTAVKKKTLFQVFAERVLYSGSIAGRPLPVAIMTSPLNDDATRGHFIDNNYFGLESHQVTFFCQEMLPFIDDSGDYVLESPGRLARGPDGNGSSLYHFVHSGIADSWKRKGVDAINFVQVDNILADPFDPQLFGLHSRQGACVTVKCSKRLNEDEKVGLLVRTGRGVEVVEYSELPEGLGSERNEDGELRYNLANLSQFCFSLNFLESFVQNHWQSMGYHLAHKKAGKIYHQKCSTSPMVWKFERFIFDVLPYANNVQIVVYPRERCFAPLKNRSGPDSLGKVQQALQLYDRSAFARVTGKEPADKSFELDPAFYYPTPALLRRWKGKPLPEDSYVAAAPGQAPAKVAS